MVYNWINKLQNWLLPNTCVLCGQAGQDKLALCRDCHNDLKFIDNPCASCSIPLPAPTSSGLCGQCLIHPPHFDSATCLFVYDTPVRQLIQSLKFHNKLVYARLLGRLLAMSLANRKQALPDCIFPVPLSSRRLHKRGFNQSLELARPVSRALGVPIDHRLLSRVRHTPPQSQLKLKERHKNVRNAFRLSGRPVPAHVAILDDVVTTGSTCNELAAMLKKAGAVRVEVWSIARALK